MSQSTRDVQAPLFSPRDAERFGEIVERHFGLFFPANRQDELERGVLQAFATSTCRDLDAFYRLVEAEARPGSAPGLELERLVNALTVGETYFFRDAGQFDALYHTVLPELIERRRRVRTLRVWSAGCASGEEPYSIAMMLCLLLPDIDEWSITVLGTDINAESLARAREGVFGHWAFREERAQAWRDRFFAPVNGPSVEPPPASATRQRWALVPEVRRLVTFRRLNLANENYPSLTTNTAFMDLILCRNVTIYFSDRATRLVIEKLHAALGQDAWLVVGHAEPSPARYAHLEPHNFPGAVLYRRVQHDPFSVIRQTAPLPPTLPAPGPATAPGTPPGTCQRGACRFAVGARAPEKHAEAHTTNGRSDRPSGCAISDRAPETHTHASEREIREVIEQAREMLEYGHSEQACQVLEAIVARGDVALSLAPDVYALLGQGHANLGDLPTAEQWCWRAIAADRLALDAYYTLALVLQHQARLDEAIDAMKKVVYIDRHSILGHYGLANLYRSRGQEDLARKAMENVRRLLENKPPGEIIPSSGGITAGRLYKAVMKQPRHTPDMRLAHAESQPGES
ncbi:MAG: hypothetical protein JXA93_19120 [Anaerolineae bacterium]|nr:hypothetical protein [Anaerolineae bacterium]